MYDLGNTEEFEIWFIPQTKLYDPWIVTTTKTHEEAIAEINTLNGKLYGMNGQFDVIKQTVTRTLVDKIRH